MGGVGTRFVDDVSVATMCLFPFIRAAPDVGAQGASVRQRLPSTFSFFTVLFRSKRFVKAAGIPVNVGPAHRGTAAPQLGAGCLLAAASRRVFVYHTAFRLKSFMKSSEQHAQNSL